jgi:hypothetical protein
VPDLWGWGYDARANVIYLIGMTKGCQQLALTRCDAVIMTKKLQHVGGPYIFLPELRLFKWHNCD